MLTVDDEAAVMNAPCRTLPDKDYDPIGVTSVSISIWTICRSANSAASLSIGVQS
jgi:hypothetical protein